MTLGSCEPAAFLALVTLTLQGGVTVGLGQALLLTQPLGLGQAALLALLLPAASLLLGRQPRGFLVLCAGPAGVLGSAALHERDRDQQGHAPEDRQQHAAGRLLRSEGISGQG